MNTNRSTHWFGVRGWIWIALVLAGAAGGWILRGFSLPAAPSAADAEETSVQATLWTCSMHPQIQMPTKGLCPLCGMDLIPVESGGSTSAGEATLILSPAARKLASVQTERARRAPAVREIRMTGILRTDETREREISAWIAGRVEKLHVDFTGRPVRRGQPLLEIYSPELFAAQEELLQAVRNPALARLEPAAREKLRLLGLNAEQVEEILSHQEARATVTVPAPISGVVLEKRVQVGQTVMMGETLYRLADLARLWLEIDAYEADLPWTALGDTVSFETDAYPGETFSGRIVFIDPMVQPETRTVRLRVEVDNADGRLKPAMFARARVQSRVGGDAGDPLVIPASAPLLTGDRAIVYVADPSEEGRYEGREVVLGPRAGDVYVVLEGLEEGEEVVSRGAFKIDSEIQIRAGKSMMQAPEREADSRLAAPESFLAELRPLYVAYFQTSELLSRDQADSARQAARRLVDAAAGVEAGALPPPASVRWRALRSEIERRAGELASAGEISTARSAFHPLSNAVIDLAREIGPAPGDSVFVYHCPMAFSNQGADWLQRRRGVENPYFGAQMFRCGSETRTIAGHTDASRESDRAPSREPSLAPSFGHGR